MNKCCKMPPWNVATVWLNVERSQGGTMWPYTASEHDIKISHKPYMWKYLCVWLFLLGNLTAILLLSLNPVFLGRWKVPSLPESKVTPRRPPAHHRKQWRTLSEFLVDGFVFSFKSFSRSRPGPVSSDNSCIRFALLPKRSLEWFTCWENRHAKAN